MARFPHGDPDVVVREVLAQAAYARAAATTARAPQPTLLEIAWTWFRDHVLAPIVGTIGRALGASPNVGTAIGIAAIVVALGILVYVVVRATLDLVRPRARTDHGTQETGLANARDAAAWVAFARASAARGDFASAIAALFAAALATLDDRALVRFDAARTPGEYRRLVRRECARAADAFDEITGAFVRARFAPQTPDAEAFAAAQRAYERFVPAASRS